MAGQKPTSQALRGCAAYVVLAARPTGAGGAQRVLIHVDRCSPDDATPTPNTAAAQFEQWAYYI